MRKLLLASAATMGALLVTAGGAAAQPVKPVAAGTIVVHLNGYLQFEIGDTGSTYNTVGLYKLNPITTDGDARLYGGIDAKTISGVDYGAQIELRTTTSDAGVAAGKSTGTTGTAGSSSLYIKRAYGYLGTVENGYVRLGQGDSAFTLLQTGVVEAFGDGAQWNTDGGIYSALPTNAAPSVFIYADTSGLYATDKVVYISPKYDGFGLAAGYEPNSNGIKEGYAANVGTSPLSTSADLSSSPTAGDIGKRRRNTVDAALSYALTANGFATKANAGIIYGAPIDYDGAKVAAGSALHYGYDNLSVYQVGAQTTYLGVTVGANIKAGQTLDSYSFKPKGARDALAYIIGATYVVGPYVIGGSFFDSQTAGSYVPGAKEGRTLEEYGAAAGGNYVVGKDLSLFVQYLYGHRHQVGNTALSAHGNTQVQAIATGATFKW
jgi:hypothetical protein